MSDPRSLLHRLRSEEGASAVIVAVSMFVLLGGALVAVDAGSLWQTKRNQVTDTDAAALAAARYIRVNGDTACLEAETLGVNSLAGQEAEDVFIENDASTTWADDDEAPFDVEADCVSNAGHVRVATRLDAELVFAPLFGFSDLRSFARSTAQFGPLIAAEGLRPIGICDKDHHFEEWATYQNSAKTDADKLAYEAHETLDPQGHPQYSGAWVTHRVIFDRLPTDPSCGDGPGNWGWIDFNSTSPPNGNSALRTWLEDGYDSTVSLTDPHDCNPESAGDDKCPPKSGAGGGSLSGVLDTLVCPDGTDTEDCEAFPIIVYDDVSCTGGGTTCEYNHVAFVMVVLRGYNKITGNEKTSPQCEAYLTGVSDDPKNCPYFDLEFTDQIMWTGRIGPNPNPLHPTIDGVQLCGVDHDVVDNRCDV